METEDFSQGTDEFLVYI